MYLCVLCGPAHIDIYIFSDINVLLLIYVSILSFRIVKESANCPSDRKLFVINKLFLN